MLTSELGESAGSQLLNINTLLLGDAGGETESLDGATDTDPDEGTINIVMFSL